MEKLKIKWMGFAGTNHSWAIVAQNLSRQFMHLGHTVHINSTNGLEHFPDDLKPLLTDKLENDYDLEMSYTKMSNFPYYLNSNPKSIKFGIYCFEFSGKNALPIGFAKHYNSCTKILPPSQYAKQVFLDSGIPESSIEVVHHGVDKALLTSADKYEFKTKKKTKILIVVGQPHLRKGLDLSLEAFGKAFTHKDDVCLIIKVVDKEPTQGFEVSFKKLYHQFNLKYPKHAEIKVITNFIPNMGSIYRECDIHFNLTMAEGFGIPFCEAILFNLINIAPRYGGQLDFLNEDNSLLVSGTEEFAPANALYHQQKIRTKWFRSDIDDAVDKLRFAVDNVENLKNKFAQQNASFEKQYSWENISNQILDLYKSVK